MAAFVWDLGKYCHYHTLSFLITNNKLNKDIYLQGEQSILENITQFNTTGYMFLLPA